MKRLGLILGMTIITLSVYSQKEQTYTEEFDSLFYYVSKTQATTSILYDRVVTFADLESYNSNVNSSVDTSDFSHFIQSYSEIYRAAFDTTARLTWTLKEFKEQVKNNITPDIVDIGMLHYKFNVIDTVVAEQKLIDNNGIFYENPSIITSLYLEKTAFVATPLATDVKSYGNGEITFRFNNSFYFDNTGDSLIQLQIDFGDDKLCY